MDSQSHLILLSDHGFAPFTREFHLSTWMVQNGFTTVTDQGKYHGSTFYDYVDWRRTRAYAMGLNSIYLNLSGREFQGSVFQRDRQKIIDELIRKLEAFRDPVTGQRVVKKAYDARQLYKGAELQHAPDIVLGYESGYRISDEAVLGKFPEGIVDVRRDRWSADHCMDPSVVPGVLLTDLEVQKKQPSIWDLAPTIINLFQQKIPHEMDGKSII